MNSLEEYQRRVAAIEAAEEARRDFRARRMNELLEIIRAKTTRVEPQAAEADQWNMCIDMDGGPPIWTPRAESEEYLAMRCRLVYGHA